MGILREMEVILFLLFHFAVELWEIKQKETITSGILQALFPSTSPQPSWLGCLVYGGREHRNGPPQGRVLFSPCCSPSLCCRRPGRTTPTEGTSSNCRRDEGLVFANHQTRHPANSLPVKLCSRDWCSESQRSSRGSLVLADVSHERSK